MPDQDHSNNSNGVAREQQDAARLANLVRGVGAAKDDDELGSGDGQAEEKRGERVEAEGFYDDCVELE